MESIDNKLSASTKIAGKYENAANDFKARFASNAGAGELVTVEKDNKSISLIPVQSKNVKAKVNADEMTYPGLFADTDVRYRVQGSGVKEDIIRLPLIRRLTSGMY